MIGILGICLVLIMCVNRELTNRQKIRIGILLFILLLLSLYDIFHYPVHPIIL